MRRPHWATRQYGWRLDNANTLSFRAVTSAEHRVQGDSRREATGWWLLTEPDTMGRVGVRARVFGRTEHGGTDRAGHHHGPDPQTPDHGRTGTHGSKNPPIYSRHACSTGDRKSTRLNSSHVSISYAVGTLPSFPPRRSSDLGGFSQSLTPWGVWVCGHACSVGPNTVAPIGRDTTTDRIRRRPTTGGREHTVPRTLRFIPATPVRQEIGRAHV